MMKGILKATANCVSLVIACPFGFASEIERKLSANSTVVFDTCGQLLSLVPGRPGVYVRRAFYSIALDDCSLDCVIWFGTIITKRSTRIERGVYIGNYALIGSAWLKADCLIGSRASLLSGGQLHTLQDDGKWGPIDKTKITQICIGEASWIGEGVVVMADVGKGAMVAAGSVVSSPVKSHIVVAGNPARFARTLGVSPAENEAQEELLPG